MRVVFHFMRCSFKYKFWSPRFSACIILITVAKTRYQVQRRTEPVHHCGWWKSPIVIFTTTHAAMNTKRLNECRSYWCCNRLLINFRSIAQLEFWVITDKPGRISLLEEITTPTVQGLSERLIQHYLTFRVPPIQAAFYCPPHSWYSGQWEIFR